jgi:hypothetical protein
MSRYQIVSRHVENRLSSWPFELALGSHLAQAFDDLGHLTPEDTEDPEGGSVWLWMET